MVWMKKRVTILVRKSNSAGAELPHEFSNNVKRTGMLLWRLCHMTGSHLTSTPFTRL
jgi:hypothetical protein